MVSNGMAAAGYEYINIDAGYLTHERDAVSKKLVVNPAKFPSGMRHVSDYIHSKGLKVRSDSTSSYGSTRTTVLSVCIPVNEDTCGILLHQSI